MKFIKNTILLFFIFFIGSAIIDLYVGNTNVSMFLGLVLAIVIILKIQGVDIIFFRRPKAKKLNITIKPFIGVRVCTKFSKI